MKLLIVTGMSGAGKSQAANVLEDMGYYCVDNIPPQIIMSFVELSKRGSEEFGKLAVVTDVRGGDTFKELSNVLDRLKRADVEYQILFLDASDECLVRRYKENRRKHPLCDKYDISVSAAIKKERELLKKIRFVSDFVLDTTLISNSQLKKQISDLFAETQKGAMNIICRSFGFKYGIDVDADTVFDVRCLANPYYVDKLKKKTGKDKDVRDYVMENDQSIVFKKRIIDFVDYALPLYADEGKSQLIISFGCTGGKHRSVTFAEMLYEYLKEKGYSVSVMHRDIEKD